MDCNNTVVLVGNQPDVLSTSTNAEPENIARSAFPETGIPVGTPTSKAKEAWVKADAQRNSI
jgi:hypothetical protein